MSDWDTVTVLKKRAPKASTMKSEQAINAARRQGVAIETQLKCKIFLFLESSVSVIFINIQGVQEVTNNT